MKNIRTSLIIITLLVFCLPVLTMAQEPEQKKQSGMSFMEKVNKTVPAEKKEQIRKQKQQSSIENADATKVDVKKEIENKNQGKALGKEGNPGQGKALGKEKQEIKATEVKTQGKALGKEKQEIKATETKTQTQGKTQVKVTEKEVKEVKAGDTQSQGKTQGKTQGTTQGKTQGKSGGKTN
ncbi:MAG: hypothetical protein JXR58_05510 [Bacteroidales bacterium]|nr:hypothetical protein [Bacteroidales bacterium]